LSFPFAELDPSAHDLWIEIQRIVGEGFVGTQSFDDFHQVLFPSKQVAVVVSVEDGLDFFPWPAWGAGTTATLFIVCPTGTGK